MMPWILLALLLFVVGCGLLLIPPKCLYCGQRGPWEFDGHTATCGHCDMAEEF